MILPRHIKTASIYTLGCRLNQADTALIADQLEHVGVSVKPWKSHTDLVIINSCAVTNTASSKTRQVARGVRRRLPDATIVVIGCDVKNAGESWQATLEVDAVLENSSKSDFVSGLAAVLDGRRPPEPMDSSREAGRTPGFKERGVGHYTERTRANLKIQEGCDFYCSYCIVPHVRGPSRSRDWDDIIREAVELERREYREITLTGVNIATFTSGKRDLADLLAELVVRTSGVRFRLSSTEPGPVIDSVLSLMVANSRICRFLHLPMQYGENSILRAMNRRYTREDYAEFVVRASASCDGICVGSDLIVGFPGETDNIFDDCFQFVESLPLSYLHVFSFSPRAGTPAADFPDQVAGDIASLRCAKMRRLAEQKAEAFAESQIGERIQILTENINKAGHWEGWSDNYLRVELEFVGPTMSIAENQFIMAEIQTVDTGRHVRALAVS